ncbi:MAG: 70-kilodalton heat shock protein [Watsoniomyces obsoletus]|nr:MAG: 70-kilodalton heat shock protein [Watsoniomyces obsoletus]
MSSSPDANGRPNNQSTDTSNPSPKSVDKPPPPRALTRDEQADIELQEFIASVIAEERDPRIRQRRQHTATPHTSQTSPSTSSTSTSKSIAPDSLYPTEMICREKFDEAFYCQSPGGQIVNVYRYGGLKDCRAHWGAFWFCMKMKSRSPGERQRRVQDFYRQREVKYKLGPSSEDVWALRKEPFLGAFRQQPEREDEG